VFAMDIKKYIGGRIKHFRNEQGLSQDALAEKLGTTRQTVSRYENGDRQANQDILFKLSDVFNVSIDDFFPNNDKKNNELDRALRMTDGLELKDMEFLNQLIEKTLSLKGTERERFLESIRFTVDYYNKMNE